MNKTEYVVGVTGHRDIHPDALDTIREQVRLTFDELQRSLPNTAIRLISGMADGADRIVAEEALARGIKVDAILPMPLEMYLDDFSKPSALELRKLLEHPDVGVEEIPLPNDRAPSLLTQTDRDQLYVGLARVISRRCSLLIALWDGVDTGLAGGGTSNTLLNFINVRAQGDGEPVQYQRASDAAHHGPSGNFAAWIVTTRANATEIQKTRPAYLTGRSGRVVMDDAMPNELSNRISKYDAYNVTFGERLQAGDLSSPYSLMGAVPKSVGPGDLRALEKIEREFEKADVMAIYYQKYSDRLFAGFALAAGLMGFLFLVYAKVLASNYFLFGYLGMFIGGYFAFKYAHSKHWFSKHLMYRLIAETMRARFYLSLAGLGEGKQVQSLEKMTGIKQFSGFGWISDLFKFVEPTSAQSIIADAPSGLERLQKNSGSMD